MQALNLYYSYCHQPGGLNLHNRTASKALPVEIRGTVNILSDKQYDRDIFVRNGGVLTVSNNALLKAPNRSIIVENGGRITLNNGGEIESKLMDINLGGTIESNSGTTVTIQ